MIRTQDKHNWFGRTFRDFSAVVEPFKGQPIVYVEVGVWKADSAHWMMSNIVTHPDAWGYGIDPYQGDFKRGSNEPIREQAVERMKDFANWRWIFKKSQDALRFWDSADEAISRAVSEESDFCDTGDKIDLLYLDGSHLAHDVLMDWCFAWPHLKAGSVVILDDWGLSKRKKDGILRVDVAVESIEKSFAPHIERIGRWKTQAAFKLTKEPLIGELP